MKIGFPYLKTNDTGEVILDSSFRSSPYFGIFDVNDQSISVIDFRSEVNTQGELHIFFKTRGVDTLISPECHPMAAKYFTDHEISIYKSSGIDLVSNIKAFMDSNLDPFNAMTVQDVSSCNSSCGSCHSKCK